MTVVEEIVVKKLGRAKYQPTWQAMREFTRGRQDATPDELWLVEHFPVYTVGQGAQVPEIGNAIPVVKTDRGGDITYHGPGQLVGYPILTLPHWRDGLTDVVAYVRHLEDALIALVSDVTADRRSGAAADRDPEGVP